MTKHLKCIGGVWDGRTVALQDGHRQLVVRKSERASDIVPSRSVGPATFAYTEHLYVLDQVNVKDSDPIQYLRPSEWDGVRALQHALGAA